MGDFLFESDQVVVINNKITFFGEILSGEVKVGDRLAFQGRNGAFEGRVFSIIDNSKPGVGPCKVQPDWVSIQLHRFNQRLPNEALLMADHDPEDLPQESPAVLLGLDFPVLLEKVAGPERLPKVCPSCEAELMYAHPSMSVKARRLRLFSMLAAPILIMLGMYFLAVQPDFGQVLTPRGVLVFLCSPFLIMLWIAYRIPRVIPLECFKCGWFKEIPVGEMEIQELG